MNSLKLLMRSTTIPGFREIFPDEQISYANLVRSLGSDTIIKLCAAINSELTCPEPRWEIQSRLNFTVVKRFTDEQRSQIFRGFGLYKEKAGDHFQGMIFFRRYLVAMILKELNNFRVVEERDDQSQHEFIFLKAYLQIIDEVNDGDQGNMDFKALDKSDPSWVFKLCWLPIIRQFELNEKGNMIFEMLKTACLLQFASKNYREALREYLAGFGLSSPGQLMGSFNAIYRITELYDPNAMLRKYTLIDVDERTNVQHLDAQTLHPKPRGKFGLADLKKKPIFFSPQRQKHVVLDNYFAHRKVFRGPYFELFHQTCLKPKDKALQDEAFTKYSQNVTESLEKRCLKPILTQLAGQSADVIHFDDGSKSVPDGYIRIDRTIFLFEYKAYFFPEKLVQHPDFDALKAYFDSRFIESDKGQEKGVGQLKKQIDIIYSGGFHFDKEVDNLLKDGCLTIYPIITYNDFYFGLPALNVYLQQAFMRLLPSVYADKLSVAPVILMNLESILDMGLTGQGMGNLQQHIHHFANIVTQAETAFQHTLSTPDFFLAHASFDELYNWQFAPKPSNLEKTQEMLQKLLTLTGISLDELEMPLD